MRALITLVLLAGVVASGGYYYLHYYAVPVAPVWNLAKVERGNLDLTIRSTGTIQAEQVVDVGAQVAGRIVKFGDDPNSPSKHIDYNSKVEAGTDLAFIDPELFQSQVDSAKANVEKANADIQTAQAHLHQSQNDLKRAELTFAQKAISQTDYDAAVATNESNIAALAVAKAELNQFQAALHDAVVNLGYTIIKSPIKGTIIDRRVNVGQTVVASLSAPSLFLIAQDMTKMQVWAMVNEADIERIHAGQSATFTVDALPGRTFPGKVLQVRYSATMTQNVVTYTVVIDANNADEALRPYQTATVLFDAGRHENVLQVPNAALRWRPLPERVDPAERDAYVKKTKARLAGNGARPGGGGSSGSHAGSSATGGDSTSGGAHAKKHADDSTTGQPNADAGKTADGKSDAKSAKKTDKEHHDHGTLWVVSDDGLYVRPIQVRTGVSDDAMTEIITDKLKEDDQVVVGEDHSASAAQDSQSNPLGPPKMFGGGKR